MKYKTLFITIIALVTYNCTTNVTRNVESKEDILNSQLERFAKIYGLVKYFHPSDEAADINWDDFLLYGVDKIFNSQRNNNESEILDSLFTPLVKGFKINSKSLNLNLSKEYFIDSLVLSSWQHEGIMTSFSSRYTSIRLGRINKEELRNGLSYAINKRYKLRNKKLKLLITSNYTQKQTDDFGEVELELYNPLSKNSTIIKSKKITGFSTEEIHFEHLFKDDDNGYLGFIIRNNGFGKFIIKDISAILIDTKTSKIDSLFFENFSTYTDFKENKEWKIFGDYGYKYQVDSTNHNYLTISSLPGYTFGALYPNEIVDTLNPEYLIDNEWKVTIPLSLLLPTKTKLNPEFLNLKSKVNSFSVNNASKFNSTTKVSAIIELWNVFQHFYPYMEEIKKNIKWDELLSELIEGAINTPNDKYMFLKYLETVVAKLYDGHGYVSHSSSDFERCLSADFTYIDGKILITQSENSELKRGDIVISLDSVDSQTILRNKMQYISGSEQWKKNRASLFFGCGDTSKTVEIKLIRDNEIVIVNMKRNSFARRATRINDTLSSIREVSKNIAYVNLSKIKNGQLEDSLVMLKTMKAIIFDLREYPKCSPSFLSFLSDSPIKSGKWKTPQFTYPNQQNVTYDTSGRWLILPSESKINSEIIFLAGGGTISYGESLLAIIKNYKLGTIIGSNSAGANGNKNNFKVAGGYKISFTGMKVLNHDNSQLHILGITPDVQQSNVLNLNLFKKTDPLLNQAINHINN